MNSIKDEPEPPKRKVLRCPKLSDDGQIIFPHLFSNWVFKLGEIACIKIWLILDGGVMSNGLTKLMGQVLDRVLSAPDLGNVGATRMLLVARGALPLGLSVHFSWIFLFFAVGVNTLAWLNILVSCLWFWSLLTAWGVFPATARNVKIITISTCVVEIPLHAVVATVWLGPDPGFQFLVLVAMAVMSFAFVLSFRQRVVLICTQGVLFITLFMYSTFAEPIQLLPPFETSLLLVSNLMATVTGIILVLVAQDIVSRHAEDRLTEEHDRAERLLLNILPPEIAEKLKTEHDVIADEHSQATVLFADIVDFTEASASMSAGQLVARLNVIFSEFDRLAERHGVEKIKTIGDAYMVVAGLPGPREDHAQVMVDLAREMVTVMPYISGSLGGRNIPLRVGINTGPVVAGVIGQSKFAYDLWGDTVNVAARMEQASSPNEIRLSETTYQQLTDHEDCEDVGELDLKGKGRMRAYAIRPLDG